MKIPSDAIIPDEKLTQYLLVFKAKSDKSKFLAQAGFTLDNPDQLKAAIQALATATEAILDEVNEYGVFYRVEGVLIGANGRNLPVVTIWLQRQQDGTFQFITLKPNKEHCDDP